MKNSDTPFLVIMVSCFLISGCLLGEEPHQGSMTDEKEHQDDVPKYIGNDPDLCDNKCSMYSHCAASCEEYPTHDQITCRDFGVCNDQDGDGRTYPSDNCESTYNPGQANCDGDGAGDACDGENATTYTQPEYQYQSSFYESSGGICSMYMRYWEPFFDLWYIRDKTTKTYCGPQAYLSPVVSYSNGRYDSSFRCYGLRWTCAQGSSWPDPVPGC
jgi:hypothetical protein